MSSDEYEKLSGRLRAIERRLDSIEANSPPRASSEQSIVGPPEKVESENPALARPATLPEVISELMGVASWLRTIAGEDLYTLGKAVATEQIIQVLKELDQGPIASRPPKEKIQKRASHPNSEHVQ